MDTAGDGTSNQAAQAHQDSAFESFVALYGSVVAVERQHIVFNILNDLRHARGWTDLSVSQRVGRPPCVRGRDPQGDWADVLVLPAYPLSDPALNATPENLSRWTAQANGMFEREVLLALVDDDSTTVYMRIADQFDYILADADGAEPKKRKAGRRRGKRGPNPVHGVHVKQ